MIKQIKIAVSSCLLGENVRYNGKHKLSTTISDKTPKHIELVPICPEVAIGLGVPRTPIKLIRPNGLNKLIQHDLIRPNDLIKLTQHDNHSIDHSNAMGKFASSLSGQFKQVSGYILMEKSPSCALASAKVYDKQNKLLSNQSPGLFVIHLQKTWPMLPMIESIDFEDYKKREKFFTDVSNYTKTVLATW